MIFSCSKASKQFSFIIFSILLISVCLTLLLLEQKRWRADEFDTKTNKNSTNLTLFGIYLDEHQINRIEDAISVFRIVLSSFLCITITVSIVALILQIIHQAKTKLDSSYSKFNYIILIVSFLTFGMSLICLFSIIFLEKLQTAEEKWNITLIAIFMGLTLLFTSLLVICVVIYLCVTCERNSNELNECGTMESTIPSIPPRLPSGNQSSAELKDLGGIGGNMANRGGQPFLGFQTVPRSKGNTFFEANGKSIEIFYISFFFLGGGGGWSWVVIIVRKRSLFVIVIAVLN